MNDTQNTTLSSASAVNILQRLEGVPCFVKISRGSPREEIIFQTSLSAATGIHQSRLQAVSLDFTILVTFGVMKEDIEDPQTAQWVKIIYPYFTNQLSTIDTLVEGSKVSELRKALKKSETGDAKSSEVCAFTLPSFASTLLTSAFCLKSDLDGITRFFAQLTAPEYQGPAGGYIPPMQPQCFAGPMNSFYPGHPMSNPGQHVMPSQGMFGAMREMVSHVTGLQGNALNQPQPGNWTPPGLSPLNMPPPITPPWGFQQPNGMPPGGSPFVGNCSQPGMTAAQFSSSAQPPTASNIWQYPTYLPVKTLEAGKVVLYVEGKGFTFFEGKDIEGVCKILNKCMYTQTQGVVNNVDWYNCSLEKDVKALRFPRINSNINFLSWETLWSFLTLGQSKHSSAVLMDHLKTFIWAELPELAKTLDVRTAGVKSKEKDPVAEYFKEQQLQADRNRQA